MTLESTRLGSIGYSLETSLDRIRDVARDEGLSSQAKSVSPEILFAMVQQAIDEHDGHQPIGCFAALVLDEWPEVQTTVDTDGRQYLLSQVTAAAVAALPSGYVAALPDEAQVVLWLPQTSPQEARLLFDRLGCHVISQPYRLRGQRLVLTPAIGIAPCAPCTTVERLITQASMAASYAAMHLDLCSVCYDPKMEAPAPAKAPSAVAQRGPRWWQWCCANQRSMLQFGVSNGLGLVLPFCLYVNLARYGVDITNEVYLGVVATLLITAYFILLEAVLAFHPPAPPDRPATPYPPASAIIAAYLPNEAATIIETVEAFLRLDYPAPLQIILAYNTPRDMAIEATFQEMAQRDPRFVPLRVYRSTSKAQNVNVALSAVQGDFVGVFDADHHPDPDSFQRAWRWLAEGYDVVQGHCLVRNGDESWVARLVAVEFELIYAVSHPGRAMLHGFGIFGGSNGYWKTALLRRTRMRGSMLTEDIDSSLRVVEDGARIASDPCLISRELAPVSLEALWNQRMRWAQGWFQVSYKHLWQGLTSPHLSPRQKLGIFHLLAWREFYPWLSLQVFPIVSFRIWEDGGFKLSNFLVPMFLLSTLFVFSTGPIQALIAFLRSERSIQQNKMWFVLFLVISTLFYMEFKNTIARIAQIKEIMRERQWKVTPRSPSKESLSS